MCGYGSGPAQACVGKDDPPAGTSQCQCDVCSKVQQASLILNHLWLDESQDEHVMSVIDEAFKAVREAKDKLHHLHRPEYYEHSAECHLKELEDEEPALRSDTNAEATNDGISAREPDALEKGSIPYITRDYEKFMVCDHCRGHGLPCNEAAVCNQCQSSATACIHRLCEYSPTSRKDCPISACRYLHKDFLPALESVPASAYVVLPGYLRGLHLDGKRPPFKPNVTDCNQARLEETRQDIVNRQEEAWQEIEAAVSAGRASLSDIRGCCGQKCRITREEASGLSDDDHGLDKPTDKGHVAAVDMRAPGTIEAMIEKCVCVSCEGDTIFYALAPCNHKVCLRCTIARRYILGDNSCHKCSRPRRKILLMSGKSTTFRDLLKERKPLRTADHCKEIGVYSPQEYAVKATEAMILSLLEYPSSTACGKRFLGAKVLISHLRDKHGKLLCKGCLLRGKPLRASMFSAKEFWIHSANQHRSRALVAEGFLWAPEWLEKVYGGGRMKA